MTGDLTKIGDFGFDPDGPPVEGYFKVKLTKGGVFVPVRIARICGCSVGGFEDHDWTGLCDRYPALSAIVNGAPADLDKTWERSFFMIPVSRKEYEFMLADKTWCEANAPQDPKANPSAPIDLNRVKPPF